MNKEEKIKNFDPDAPGTKDSGMFGLPFDSDESAVIVLPVPWEVTVSYRPGTAGGPEAVMEASYQVDLFDEDLGEIWQEGIWMDKVSRKMKRRSTKLRSRVEQYLEALEAGVDLEQSELLKRIQKKVNKSAGRMVDWVEKRSRKWLDEGKLVALLGGDHSTPLGLMKALKDKHGEFSVLQVDAHADLRQAYEGFEYSHASIMANAMEKVGLEKLVQVGIRDVGQQEMEWIREDEKIECFSWRDISRRKFSGANWDQISDEIVEKLGKLVYISFDIDGLDPKYCRMTGTPVPGGLDFEEACFLIEKITASGRKIIGLDLVEVVPSEDEYDHIVGARLLYRMVNQMIRSNQADDAS